MRILSEKDLSKLPTRPANGHKGTFGRVLIVGGSIGMSGAAFLAAKAAYRAGAGLVRIFSPEENRIIYQTQLPEAVLTLYRPDNAPSCLKEALDHADAVAIGMGLPPDALTKELVRAMLSCPLPLVADAGALSAIAASPELLSLLRTREIPAVLTPHPGEAARLLGSPLPPDENERPAAAARLREITNAVVVLKSHRTVIDAGAEPFLCPFGNCGMATAGSGDVLAGMIAAFLAVCPGGAFSADSPKAGDAACLGVLAHALAGDRAKEKRGLHGLMASDILEALPQLLD